MPNRPAACRPFARPAATAVALLLASAPWSPVETLARPTPARPTTGALARPVPARPPAEPGPPNVAWRIRPASNQPAGESAPYGGQRRFTAQTPVVGQEGKDVEWVPTPDALVDKMLEMAAVTPDDFVIDLGSGDGRLVIAAARLGARATGVELEPNLVALSERRAAEAGVADRTAFFAADLFEFDLSPATVVTMFLLPDINYRLRPALFDLRPGTRIVSNTWDLRGSDTDPDASGWAPDATVVLDPCPTWCTALLWIVPAKVAGAWQTDAGELLLDQQFQKVSGQLRTADGAVAITDGRLDGDRIRFQAGDASYTGRVADGSTMRGTVRTSDGVTTEWHAVRQP